MGFKNFLLSASLAGSVLGSEPSPVQDINLHTQDSIARIHTSSHPHIEISFGLENGHLLEHGQMMEGDFYSFGIHGSLDRWNAYYHWLQSSASTLEHKVGLTHSVSLGESCTGIIGISGVYEIEGSQNNTMSLLHDSAEHSDTLASNLYAGLSVELKATLAQTEKSVTTITVGGEYDFGTLNTSFVDANLEHTQNIGNIQFTMGARLLEVLDTNSTHIHEGTLGVVQAGLKIPLGEGERWFLEIGGGVTTHGDRGGKIGFSRSF